MNTSNYERFTALLYASNGTKSESISDRYNANLQALLSDESVDRGEPLVDIGAYALMPTHVHFVLRQLRDEGIARFMQKVFTGYTMYFNIRNDRTGALFAGTYKSKHISDDRYLKRVVPYVLLNPVELFEPGWKTGSFNMNTIEKKLLAYPHSSLRTFLGQESLGKKITGQSLSAYYDHLPNLKTMLKDAREYYRTESPEVNLRRFNLRRLQ